MLFAYLSLQLSERILDVEDGLKNRAFQHRDEGVEIGTDLFVVPQVLRLPHLELHLFQKIEGSAGLARYWHSHWGNLERCLEAVIGFFDTVRVTHSCPAQMDAY